MRDRSAFGYAEPSPDIPDFAQCGTCRLWIKPLERCLWLTPDKEVVSEASCIAYAQGSPILSDESRPLSVYTAAELGFIDGKVRCENCSSLDENATACNLYRKLNAEFPKLFALVAKVKRRACCNAFEA